MQHVQRVETQRHDAQRRAGLHQLLCQHGWAVLGARTTAEAQLASV